MKPSLETIAGLYAAAQEVKGRADLAVQRVLESAERHGYTKEQIDAVIKKDRLAEISTDYALAKREIK